MLGFSTLGILLFLKALLVVVSAFESVKQGRGGGDYGSMCCVEKNQEWDGAWLMANPITL